jgi:transcriptional regulator with XRE-family HTH domain
LALFNKDNDFIVNGVSAKIFDQNLERIRKSRQLKVYELANLTGMSKVWLGVLENGEKEPRPETIWKIAKALNCSVEELVNENHN